MRFWRPSFKAWERKNRATEWSLQLQRLYWIHSSLPKLTLKKRCYIFLSTSPSLPPSLSLPPSHPLSSSLSLSLSPYPLFLHFPQAERHFIMQVVCEATQCNHVPVQVAALQNLVKIMSLYYHYMEAYMGPALFAVSTYTMLSGTIL